MATECSNRRELSIFPAQGGAERDPDDHFMGTFGPLFNALSHALKHGLRTPNEGINQRYLKNWADVADKICCRHT